MSNKPAIPGSIVGECKNCGEPIEFSADEVSKKSYHTCPHCHEHYEMGKAQVILWHIEEDLRSIPESIVKVVEWAEWSKSDLKKYKPEFDRELEKLGLRYKLSCDPPMIMPRQG